MKKISSIFLLIILSLLLSGCDFIQDTNSKEPNIPVITVSGDSTSIEVGTVYENPTCVAVDAEDGSLDCNISGTVDINTSGEYKITYSATDSDGNTSQETVVITVIEKTDNLDNIPVITLQGGSSSILVGDDLDYPTCKANDVEDGELECTVDGSVNTAIAGIYKLTYNAVDSHGNNALPVTFSVTVMEVIISTLTVHFYNNDISNFTVPTLHYWYDLGEGQVNTEWPGVVMTKASDSDWYTYTIEGTGSSNVIFTSSDETGQTVDLNISNEAWFVPSGFDSESGKIIGDWYDSEPVIDKGEVLSVEELRLQILAYISNLSYGNVTEYTGTISGQNCYHGDQIADTSYSNGYESMIEDLYDETGEWVGMIGIDYEYDQIFTPEQLSITNQYLIDYSKQGGLVTINFSPQNPWVNDELDILNNPGTPNGDSSPQSDFSHSAVTSLYDLIDESKDVNEVWMRKLDRMADALEELRDENVVVLWRPMQEMNGNWMWWGMRSHPDDPQAYIAVYQHMHDYFTIERGLNNLIWVYSPNSTFGHQDAINNTSSWNRNVTWAYPGDEYVDIVAGTEYGNDVIIHDYNDYVSLGKPFGMAEIGPGSVEGDYQMDATVIINQFANHYPRVAYWVSWHWNWAIINQHKSSELLTDSRVINIGDFDTSLETGEIIDNPNDDLNPVTKSLVIHFLNNDIANMNEPHLYYWYDLGNGLIAPDWPGLLMTKESDSNWYTATIEGIDTSNVIFAAVDSSKQTIDLSRSGEGWFIPTGIDSETGKLIGTWYDTRPD